MTALPIDQGTMVRRLQQLVSRVEYRVEVMEERDGKDGAVTGPGIAIGYLFAKDLVKVMSDAATYIENQIPTPAQAEQVRLATIKECAEIAKGVYGLNAGAIAAGKILALATQPPAVGTPEHAERIINGAYEFAKRLRGETPVETDADLPTAQDVRGILGPAHEHSSAESETDPITREEMMRLFGEYMPIEAVNLVWNSSGQMTIGEVRKELRMMAVKTRDLPQRLRHLAGQLIHGTVEDGDVSTSLLCAAADEIDLLRAQPQQPAPAPLMDAGSIFTFLHERMEDNTSASLTIACRALADHLRVIRDQPQRVMAPAVECGCEPPLGSLCYRCAFERKHCIHGVALTTPCATCEIDYGDDRALAMTRPHHSTGETK